MLILWKLCIVEDTSITTICWLRDSIHHYHRFDDERIPSNLSLLVPNHRRRLRRFKRECDECKPDNHILFAIFTKCFHSYQAIEYAYYSIGDIHRVNYFRASELPHCGLKYIIKCFWAFYLFFAYTTEE